MELRHKKFLIIDDFLAFRSSLKNMLDRMGVSHIDAAVNAESALEKMAITHFDVILSDYHLGPGKNGQSLLSEARAKKIIKSSAIYMLLTAETGMAQVMAAMECEPDGYIAKPFNKQSLYHRLKKIHDRKHDLMPIYDALYQDDIEGALIACEQLSTDSSVTSDAIKIKGKILLQQGEYQKAAALYQAVLAKTNFPWALLGAAKSAQGLQDNDHAKHYYQQLLTVVPMSVDAYDGLSHIAAKQQQYVQSLNYLKQAVELSPQSLLRQQRLAQLAMQNNDSSLAEAALRQVMRLDHAVTGQANLNMIIFLLKKALMHEGLNRKKSLNEAYSIFKKSKQKIGLTVAEQELLLGCHAMINNDFKTARTKFLAFMKDQGANTATQAFPFDMSHYLEVVDSVDFGEVGQEKLTQILNYIEHSASLSGASHE